MDRKKSIGIIFNATMVCERPYWEISKGFSSQNSPLNYNSPLLLIQFIVIYFTTQTLEVLLRPSRQSKSIIQIIAGIIIGTSLLSKKKAMIYVLFPVSSKTVLNTIASFGFILHMFIMGVQIDTRLLKNMGRKSMVIGVTSYAFPVGSTLLIGKLINFINPPLGSKLEEEGLFPGGVVMSSMTFFVVTTNLLTDLKILNSELGRLAAYTSICADFCGWLIGQVGVHAEIAKSSNLQKIRGIWVVVGMLCFYMVTFFVLRPLVIMMIKNTPEGKSIKDDHFFCILLLVMVVAFFADTVGIRSELGAFLFGLSLPDGPPLGSSLVQKLDTISSGLLLPVFCTICGLRTRYHKLVGGTMSLLVTELMILFAYFSKVVSIVVASYYFNMPFWDALTLSLIMSCKGITDVAILSVSHYNQAYSESLYTLLVFTMVVVTVIVTPIVGYLYDPSTRYMAYQRTILHDTKKKNNDLQILVCIHSEDNVLPFINLIEATSPRRGRQLSVLVLQLKELTGRASSILAPHHQLTKRATSDMTISERIVNAFKYFENYGYGNVLVEHFVAIAPYASMHDDICTIALDKNICFAILPYHKIRAIDGSIDHSLMSIKLMNEKVIEKAPCSVGLLVDRGRVGGNQHALTSQTSYRIALFYIGGADDQEALAYCRRMVDNPYVTLNVFFIKPWDYGSQSKHQKDLEEEESINEFKAIALDNSRITYKNAIVRDGEGTTRIIRSMEDDYDLMIVGKHHDPYSPVISGLTDWSESPELGIIGDILASSDFQFSVLVVQQPQCVGFIDSPLVPRTYLRSRESPDESSKKKI